MGDRGFLLTRVRRWGRVQGTDNEVCFLLHEAVGSGPAAFSFWGVAGEVREFSMTPHDGACRAHW